MAKKEDWLKMEEKLNATIQLNKKNVDSVINGIINRLSKLEKELEALNKEKEMWKKEKEALEVEKAREREQWLQKQEEWKVEKENMAEQLTILKASIASLSPEEGEVTTKEALKEELTKTLTASMEDKLAATKEGWVEVVKKNIKEEAQEEAKMGEAIIIHTTLEEEKMRQARRLNVRVTGIEEEGSTPEKDGRSLCTKLGYEEEEALAFTKAWRADKDLTRERTLILQLPNDESRSTFLRKRVILRGLEGTPIYLDDDLTKLQVEHRQACMPRVHKARKEGNRAYRDGRVFIDGKAIA